MSSGCSAVFSNVPVVVGLLLFPALSVTRVALLLVAGYALQAMFLGLTAVALRRRAAPPGPIAARDRARLYRDLKHVGMIAPPIVLSLCMANFSGLVDMAFGSLAGRAAPAALDKAFGSCCSPTVSSPSRSASWRFRAWLRRPRAGGRFDAEIMRTVRFLAHLLVPAAVATGLLVMTWSAWPTSAGSSTRSAGP